MSKFAMKNSKNVVKFIDKQGYINYTLINNNSLLNFFEKILIQIFICIRHKNNH